MPVPAASASRFAARFTSVARPVAAFSISAASLLLLAISFAVLVISVTPARPAGNATGCAGPLTGITLPPGFCATIFADNIGHARQMAVAPDGTLYVNTWSGRYYRHSSFSPAGGFLVALKDKDGDGRAEITERFGETPDDGGHGGTGIMFYKDAIYAESNDRIMRYQLDPGDIAPKSKGTVVVSGLPLTGDHPMHPFTITGSGELLIDLGSATNSCQADNRVPQSPGNTPCTEKESRGGTWRYDAMKTDQKFSPAERYASGIRNGEGFAIDTTGQVFVTQHGRDQLHEDWPQFYNAEQGYELPAEEIVALKRGADYGWPECYYDPGLKKLVMAPEYGGDGKKIGLCAGRQGPVAAFPAHWAPNDFKFYNVKDAAKGFPAAYQGGAFIAFHGSWNRAPGPQGGYNIVFQPFKGGQASGKFVVFADGFAGAVKEPGRAAFRPSGLAVAADGALFISDDVHGRIWRVTYQGGNANAAVAAAPSRVSASTPGSVLPPEGIHADAGHEAAGLPVPPGSTKKEVILGAQVFLGQVGGATCSGCHGTDAKGSPLGADLTSGKWQWSDGSLDGIRKVVTAGVPRPKQHEGVMPPMGGVQLSDSDVTAVSAYVWALGHQKQ